MGYVDQTLAADERVLLRGEVHWMSYGLGGAIIVAGAFVIACGALLYPYFGISVFLFGVVILSAGIASLIANALENWGSEIALTNKRIVVKSGVVSRKTDEQQIDKVEAISVDQSVFGRLLGYGNVAVRGTGGSLTRVKMIRDAVAFRIATQRAIDAMKAAETSPRSGLGS